MTNRKCALLIFSKPPVPGLVKTRLTRERGGILTPEQAAEFFRRSLYDVSELSMHALIELQRENDAAVAADPTAEAVTYDFYVSTTPADNVELMRETYEAIGPWPMEVHYLTDAGATFDDHFDDAFSQLFALGYDAVVSVGGDIPTLPKSHITQAFQWLDYFRSLGTPGFVQAPCQECGTSLVGWCAETPMDNQGVYYNTGGKAALDAYVEKLKATGAPLSVPVAGGRCGRGERSGPRHLVPARHRGGGPAPGAVRAPARARLDQFPGAEGDHSPQREPRPAPVY